MGRMRISKLATGQQASFESHADWLSKSKWFFFCFVFLFTTRWESVGHCKSIKKEKETGFYPTHTKKKWINYMHPGSIFFYGVGWRSVEWSDRRWWPTVGWYVRMSGSRVTCRSFTMAAPFVRPVSTVTTSDVVEQPFRRNRKETSERERERVKPFPYATHNKWWRPDAFFCCCCVVDVLPCKKRGQHCRGVDLLC